MSAMAKRIQENENALAQIEHFNKELASMRGTAEELREAHFETENLVTHITALQSMANSKSDEPVELTGQELYQLLDVIRRQAQDIKDILA